jgi:hypothetical protein
MRLLIVAAGAALTLAACGSNTDANNADMNATDMNAVTDMNAGMDMNAADMNAAGGADANAATNTGEEQARDLNTNDKDTNLANGI